MSVPEPSHNFPENRLLAALPPDLPICLEIPYARPMPPLERARLALAKTSALLLGRK